MPRSAASVPAPLSGHTSRCTDRDVVAPHAPPATDADQERSMRLVKIGNRLINMDAVTIADVAEEQVDRYFGDGDPREPDATLQQAEAQAVTRWLE